MFSLAKKKNLLVEQNKSYNLLKKKFELKEKETV